MRPLLLIVLASLLLTPAISLAWGESNIGMYTTPAPTDTWWNQSILTAEGPGLYDVYLVCSRPLNQQTGADIETIGGFELNVLLPEGWFINGVVLPPNVLDLNSASHAFYCAGVIPVGSSVALLATITLGTFLESPPEAWVFVEPYYAPSLPGQMAITDANDEFSISPAYPSSGDLSMPILGINYEPIPNEGESWGGVKALFR